MQSMYERDGQHAPYWCI